MLNFAFSIPSLTLERFFKSKIWQFLHWYCRFFSLYPQCQMNFSCAMQYSKRITRVKLWIFLFAHIIFRFFPFIALSTIFFVLALKKEQLRCWPWKIAENQSCLQWDKKIAHELQLTLTCSPLKFSSFLKMKKVIFF